MEKDNNKTFGIHNGKLEAYALLGVFLFTFLAILSFIKNTKTRALIFVFTFILIILINFFPGLLFAVQSKLKKDQ